MEPRIVSNPLEVDNELHALGLSRSDLVDIIRFAESERALCTDNDPIGFDSFTVYARSGRRAREILLPKGWEKDDTNNQAAVRNPKTKVRLVPCNFDEHAGNRLVTPSNKSPKGEVSRKKTMCNLTAWLPGIADKNAVADSDGYVTYVLGIHIDDSRPTTAELSLPVGFYGSFYTKFGTRIILLDGSEDSGTVDRKKSDSDDDFDVIDINIKRK